MNIGIARSRGSRTAALLWGCTVALASVHVLAQQPYATPVSAAQALHDALSRSDEAALRHVLGADWKHFVPTDGISRSDIDTFLKAWDKAHRIVPVSHHRAVLAVGDGGWTLPIPLVMQGTRWRFDPRAGADVMRTRRIGRNELDAIQAVLAYFDAQKEYAQRDRDGDGVLAYARRIASTPGQHDGLYWPDDSVQGTSPLGPLYGGVTPGEGYHGYHFKILESQGPAAPGGAYGYVIGERMRSGFALVAWPIRYGETGVTSFMISHEGVVYQKDLGPQTASSARAMQSFNPDPTWSRVNAR